MAATRRSAVVVRRSADVVTLSLRLVGERLDARAHTELVRACEEIDLDDEIRAAVIRSNGRAFCRGDDPSVSVDTADGIAAVGRLRVPCVALLSGDALDAGLELALACDLRLAASGVKLGLTQVGQGALPTHGGTQRLPRIVGPARAAGMILLGERWSARRAREAGLLQAVCARDRLAREGARWVREIAVRAPVAQRFAKEALRAAGDLPLDQGLRLEGDLYVLLQTTRDRQEGIASFLERRRPHFDGR